jgi:hypothetical protein
MSRDFPPIREKETGDCSKLQLHLLPKFLIYNILEYMVSVGTSHSGYCVTYDVALIANVT